MKLLISLLLSMVVSAGYGATYYSISNNSWSTTNGGSSCGCTPNYAQDELHIYHNVTINGLNSTTSDIYVHSGRLTLGWHATIGANASIYVYYGATLKSGITITNNGSVTIRGRWTPSGGGFNHYGDFTTGDSANVKIKNMTFKTYSGSTTTINDDLQVQNGTFQMDGGTLQLNGEINVKSATFQINSPATAVIDGYMYVQNASFQNNSSITGNGIIAKNGNGSLQNNGSINGSNGSLGSSVNYLAGMDDPASTNTTVYYDGSWSDGAPASCTTNVVVMENVSLNSSMTMGELAVRIGVTVTIDGVSVTVCEDIENNGTIYVNNTGYLIQNSTSDNNSGSGSYQVEAQGSINSGEYNIWSSPVTDQNIVSFFEDDNLYDIFTFEASVQTWKYDFATLTPSNSNASSPFSFTTDNLLTGADGVFDVCRGYFAPGSNQIRTFYGIANNGSYSVAVETSNATTPVSWGGNDWNVLGNPYPSALDVTAFLAENYDGGSGVIANAVYYWDHPNQAYITKNNTDGDRIAKGQGFWVDAVGNGNVTINNSMRSSTWQSMRNADVFKTAYLLMGNPSGLQDEMRIYLDDRSSDDKDAIFDAFKLENGSGFNFYSRLDDLNYVFQGVPDIALNEQKTLAIGFTANEPGLYTINLDSLVRVPEHYSIYVEDLHRNMTFDLRAKGTYYMPVDSAGTYNNRLLLHIQHNEPTIDPIDTSVVNNVNEYTAQQDAHLFVDANQSLVVAFEGANERWTSLHITDLTGRTLITRPLPLGSQRETEDMSALPAGVYLVSLQSSRGDYKTFKIARP